VAFIPTPNTAKVAVHYTLFDQVIVNTLWFEKIDETLWTGAQLNTLCANVWDWSSTVLLSLLSNDLRLTLVDAVDQTNAASFYGSFSTTSIPGEIVSQSLPSGSCVTVKFSSDLTGRSYRGRNYISGIPQSVVDDNAVIDTFATSLTSAFYALPTMVSGLDCNHVIASHYHNGAPRTTGVTVVVQDYHMVDLFIDSQRRRLSGRGT